MASLAGTKRSFIERADERETTVDEASANSSHQRKRTSLPTLRSSTIISSTFDEDLTALGRLTTSSANASAERGPAVTRIPRKIVDNASVVLIGVRGSGKSTLGVIASAVFQRRLVETQHAFQESTGHSTSSYRKLFGSQQHQQKQFEVLSDLLPKHETGCIIVCGDEALDHRCHGLLRDYCSTHPVVQILRDEESIHDYLRGIGSNKVNDLLRVGGRMLQSCSNYDFFNISDRTRQQDTHHGPDDDLVNDGRFHHPFLTLKKAEKHFLRFFALITLREGSGTLEAAYPLSSIAVERRPYTYAVVIPTSQVRHGQIDIEQVESGSDAIELIVEAQHTQDSPVIAMRSASRIFADVRRSTIVPIIYHVSPLNRTALEGQKKSHGEAIDARRPYLDAVDEGLRLGPEFITVDLRLGDEDLRTIIHAKGSTQVIGDLFSHDESPKWSDAHWVKCYQRAVSLGCELVRLRRLAHPLEDNTAPQTFRDQISSLQGSSAPLIAYNTGYHGRSSAVMNPILTSVYHKSANAPAGPDSDCAVSVFDCGLALSTSFRYNPMQFYIIGASITYSLSPSMHNAGFKICGLPHSYSKYETSSLDSIRNLVDSPFFGGASITLPFKLDVIALTSSLGQHARAIGAVNTLVPVRRLQPDGSMPSELEILKQRNCAGKTVALLGENTDWIGIRSCLRRGLSPVNAVRPQTTALVLGSGGMARAAIYAMLQLGVRNIFVYSRTLANAQRIVDHFQDIAERSRSQTTPQPSNLGVDFSGARLHVLPSLETQWPTGFRQPTVIVSCIPTHAIGDSPAPNFTLPKFWLQSPTGGVVLEVAYKTLHTPLLKQIRAEADRGWVAMDGLDLLPEQGFAQFELFTGRRAPRRLMREQVLRQYRDSGVQDPGLIESRLAQIEGQEP